MVHEHGMVLAGSIPDGRLEVTIYGAPESEANCPLEFWKWRAQSAQVEGGMSSTLTPDTCVILSPEHDPQLRLKKFMQCWTVSLDQ